MADYIDHVRRLCSFLYVIAVALVLVAIHLPGWEMRDRAPIYVVLGLAFLCHLAYRCLDRSVASAAGAREHRELASLHEEFIGQTRHELRTPLTSLILAGELLARGNLSSDQRAQYVGFVQASGKRLKQIVDDLPALGRLDYRGMPLELKPVRLPTLTDLVRALPSWTKRTDQLVVQERQSPRV